MSSIIEQFKRSIAVAEKNIKIYYLKGPVLTFGLVFPFFLALAYVIGRNIPLKEILPGLVSMTAFFTSTSVGPSIVPWETRSKTLERLLCCPVALWTIMVGDMLSSFIFGFVISVIPLALTLYFGIQPLNFIILLFGLIIANLCFAALSVLLSAYPPTDIPGTTMMLSSLVKFPLVFISGVFIPIEQLPQLGIAIASVSPLTYFTDMVRQLFINRGFYPLALDFLALIAFTVAFIFAAIKLHEKTIMQRLS
ncbi:MAG: ABC transporter permease [Candidatus Verstraetearchaeota archaeon]|jgi:ABC-2 type transport system permease protein|nr:ABC transporter permease [Candidatus Verstraetearchaeota archaeon]